MTWDQISGVLDRMLIAGATWAVAKGYISASDVNDYIALVLAVASAIYGWYVNRPKAILQSAAALPTVQKVVVSSQAVADSVPSEKVDTK